VLIVEFDLDLPSVLNLREHHFARARRVRLQREATRRALRGQPPPVLPVEVLIVRIGARHLDTGDNLAASAKAVRDAISTALGVDDGPASPVTWRYGQELTTERHKVPVRRGRAVCGYKLVVRGRVRLEIRELPGEQGPDGGRDEGAARPGKDVLRGEGGRDGTKAETLRTQLACPRLGPPLPLVYLEAHATLAHTRPERYAPGALAASLLGRKCERGPCGNQMAFVRREGIDHGRQQPALGRVLGAHAIGRHDPRPKGPYQRLDGRSHHDVSRQPAALGNDKEPGTRRLHVRKRPHEARSCVCRGSARGVIHMPGRDRHALTCRPTDDLRLLRLDAVRLVGRRSSQRRNGHLGIARLRDAFRHSGKTKHGRRYSRVCFAPDGELQNLATRRVMDHAESLNSQL
jgi:hypothetical protein